MALGDETGNIGHKINQHKHVTFAAIVASVGGVLFGYDIGIISGAALQLREKFSLTCLEQEMVVSAVLVGAFFTSFVGGIIVDSWGRKCGILISCSLFIVGSLILTFSINFTMLITGRIIIGIAVSLSVTSECTYISEISPPSRRGMMVSLNEVGITVGFLLAYLMDYIFITMENGWKFMFGIAVVPAVVQILGLGFLPNSHHYLLVNGQTDEARKVLKVLRESSDIHIEEEIKDILLSIEEQKGYRYIDLFRSSGNMRGRMIMGMTLILFQQFSGNANVLYYAPTVFQHFGYKSDSIATLVSVGLGIIKVIATSVTLIIVDKIGRRSLLLIGCLLMATSIIFLGIVGTIKDSHITAGGCSFSKPFQHLNNSERAVTTTELDEHIQSSDKFVNSNDTEMSLNLKTPQNNSMRKLLNTTSNLTDVASHAMVQIKNESILFYIENDSVPNNGMWKGKEKQTPQNLEEINETTQM